MRNQDAHRRLGSGLVRGVRKKLARLVDPGRDPVPIAIIEAIANERIVPSGDEVDDPDLSYLPKGTPTTPEVKFHTARTRKRSRYPVRVPVLVGEMVSKLRGIHNVPDTPENRKLIFLDASNKCRARKNNEDPGWKDMRESDLARIINWTAAAFWTKYDVYEDIEVTMSTPNARESVARRDRLATRVRLGKHD